MSVLTSSFTKESRELFRLVLSSPRYGPQYLSEISLALYKVRNFYLVAAPLQPVKVTRHESVQNRPNVVCSLI